MQLDGLVSAGNTVIVVEHDLLVVAAGVPELRPIRRPEGRGGGVGKLLTSRYAGRRDPAWVKVKCLGRQAFVIGGFTDPQRSRV